MKGLVALMGGLLLAAIVPATASAASPYIWIDRINGEFAVQGRNFSPSSTGYVKATLGNLAGEKPFHTNDKGYFWTTFYRFTGDNSGKATANARLGSQTATATKDMPQSSTPSPSTTTTTARPATTTTTTKPTTTTTAKPGSVGSAGSGYSTNPSGWKLTFSDDFSSSVVDENKWGIYEGAGNQGHGTRKRSAVTVGGGELRITGTGDVSGGVAAKQNQTYGKYEVRAKTDKGAGYGHAILLWPSSERWPADGEMDISEVPTGDRSWSGTFTHYTTSNKVITHREDGDFSQWHTYGAEWEPGKITYFLDGRAIQTVTTSGAVPTSRHFLGLQLDVGASGAFIPPRNASTPASVSMHIDWVKVYQRP